jgi:hypothetical protein
MPRNAMPPSPTPPAASPSPALSRILQRLGAVRSRIRAVLAARGLARWVAVAAGIAIAWFLADVLLDLALDERRFVRLGLLDRPDGLPFAAWLALLATSSLLLVLTVRHRSPVAAAFAFTTAGVVGVLVWAIGRHVLSPLRARLSDESLALSVEARFRALNDRLAAALDFDREIAAPSRGESPAMMARVVEEADAEVQRLSLASVASTRGTRRAALAAGGAVAVLVLLFASMPATAALWARRSLLLERVSWPRVTTIVAVLRTPSGDETEKPAHEPYVAALGQSLTVYARARGKVPAEVEIVDRVSGPQGAVPLAHRMRPVPGNAGLFEHEFRDVRDDFTFTLRGGDDRDEEPTWSAVVRVPPRVTALRADLVYPEYLRLPPRRIEGGTLTVPEGTRVTVSFEVDAATERVEASIEDAPVALEREAAPAGVAAGDTARFRFEAVKSTRYRLRIVTKDGRENDAAADTYEVTVEPDTPPRVDWVHPRGPVETSVKGRVPLFAETRDDHGIVSMRWEVLAAGVDQPVSFPLAQRTDAAPAGANDREYGADAILSYVPFELSTVTEKGGKPLVAPTQLQVRFVATDGKGQEAAGGWTSVIVLRPEEIERGFAGQRGRAKSDVDAVRADVTALATIVDGLAREPLLGEAERQALRDAQFRAGKARADLDRAGRQVTSLFTAFVYDRLGGEAPTEALLALFDRRHRATFSRATAAREAGAVPSSEAETDVFPWALFHEVVAARRDRRVFDTGMIDKMISVLEHVVEAADRLGPATQEAAAAAARSGSPDDLKALVASATAWRTRLDAAVLAMQDWQTFAELTVMLRRMIEDQEAIERQVKELEDRKQQEKKPR